MMLLRIKAGRASCCSACYFRDCSVQNCGGSSKETSTIAKLRCIKTSLHDTRKETIVTKQILDTRLIGFLAVSAPVTSSEQRHKESPVRY
jgi:hypothetical protein